MSLGCGSACRLLCCLKPDKMETSPQVWRINEKLNEINRKLERMERRTTQPGLARRASIMSTGGHVNLGTDKCSELDEDEAAEMEDDLDMSNQSHAAKKNQKWKQTQSEAWLNDKALKRYSESLNNIQILT